MAIFGLQCQYIGKSTASNVKHSRFSRKKFAVFFSNFEPISVYLTPCLRYYISQLMSSFLVNPHHPIMLKFASFSYETVLLVVDRGVSQCRSFVFPRTRIRFFGVIGKLCPWPGGNKNIGPFHVLLNVSFIVQNNITNEILTRPRCKDCDR